MVTFEEPLDSNTTYTINMTDAIADVNENNMFPGYTYVFSTGSQIDSMMITGTVMDCNTLNPVKGATVMLYKDHSDSAVFKSRPFAACKIGAISRCRISRIPFTAFTPLRTRITIISIRLKLSRLPLLTVSSDR